MQNGKEPRGNRDDEDVKPLATKRTGSLRLKQRLNIGIRTIQQEPVSPALS